MSEANSTEPPVKPGDTLAGKYLVERVLGAGGAGVVVAAQHVQLGGQVALKFLLPSVAADAEATARFVNEARAASRITSEHVARVLDVGVLADGAPYMVMECLVGCDLRELLARGGPLPVVEAVDYVLQACEAIAEAHSLGIVHRDLKPSNLFLTRRADGSALIKVLDFGLSKTLVAPGQGGHELTRTSDIIGSPLYMSPEQIRTPKAVDTRTDIWSLGVSLYELLTLKTPFAAERTMSTLAGILSDAPYPLRALRGDVPPGLEVVILRCLMKSPEERLQSVDTLARNLLLFGGPRAVISVERINGLSQRGAPAPGLSTLSDAAVGRPPGRGGPWGVGAALRARRISVTAVAMVIPGLVVAALLAGWLVGRRVDRASRAAGPAAASGLDPGLSASAPPSPPAARPPEAQEPLSAANASSAVAAPVVPPPRAAGSAKFVGASGASGASGARPAPRSNSGDLEALIKNRR